MLWPDAVTTYCLLSNMYVIGDMRLGALRENSQRGLPVEASAAMKAPLFSPNNTSPEAVDNNPAEAVRLPVIWGRSHAISPV